VENCTAVPFVPKHEMLESAFSSWIASRKWLGHKMVPRSDLQDLRVVWTCLELPGGLQECAGRADVSLGRWSAGEVSCSDHAKSQK